MKEKNFESEKDTPVGSPSFEALAKELHVEPAVFISDLEEMRNKVREKGPDIYKNLGDMSYAGLKDLMDYASRESENFRKKKDLEGNPKVLKESYDTLKDISENSQKKEIVDKTLIDFAMSRFGHFYKTLNQRIESQVEKDSKFLNKSPEEVREQLLKKIDRKHIDDVYEGLTSFLKDGIWKTKEGGRKINKENLKSSSDFVLERMKSVEDATKVLIDGKIFKPDHYKE